MSDVQEAPETLTEAELVEAGPIIEAVSGPQVIVPRKGKLFDSDGCVEVVVIRPCVSRGKRIHGLPPIYTPQMLEAFASVYGGWLMYMDHLTPKIVEMLVQEGRSIRELGGRILKTWWDPSIRYKDDEKYGFQPGGTVARTLPQPPVKAMLEADPHILNVSHNAWPTGARKGAAPWDASLKGYLIEGIRSAPEGSVDWVPRGGAGGRVKPDDLREWEDFAVGVLGNYYDAARRGDDHAMDLSKITESELREKLFASNPQLAEALGLKRETVPPERAPASVLQENGGVTAADLKEALTEQSKDFDRRLKESAQTVESRAQEIADGIVQERDSYRVLEGRAHTLIESTGLPGPWQAELKARYSVLPSGPTSTLLLAEGETADALLESLEKLIEEDVKHSNSLIESAGGIPRVRGLGGGGDLKEARRPQSREQKRRAGAFREFLAEGNGDGKAVTDETITEMVREGVEG